MRKWRIGPTIGLAILLGIAVLGAVSSPPLTVPKPDAAAEQRQIPQHSKNEKSSFFLTTWIWARDNREAIDPIVAIGALFVAIAVAVVTGFLWGATKKLAASTDQLAQAAHEQSIEMGLTRALAERNFDLTEKQFLLAARECDLAEKQHGLQRLQYIAEYRPRIKIRSVGIEPPQAGALFQDGRIIKGHLVLVNVGAGDATIRQADYRFFWGEKSSRWYLHCMAIR